MSRRNVAWLESFSRRPVWVVWTGSLLTVLFLSLVGWAGWRVYEAYQEIEDETIGIQDLVRASSLDGTLTRTARMAAISGDLAWADQYQARARELERATERTILLAVEPHADAAATRLRSADGRLREMERQAIALVGRDANEAAREILASATYNDQKEIRSGALGEVTEALHSHIRAELELFRRRMLMFALLGAFGIVVVLGAWYAVLALIRKYVEERDRAEAAFRTGEERFRLVTDAIQDYGILMLDPHGTILTWNAGAERATGYRPEEAIGRHLSLIYTEDDVQSAVPEQEMAEAIRKGRVEREGWQIRKDGSRFWDRQVMTTIEGDRKELIGFAKIVQDLTRFKEAEERRLALVHEQAARTEAEAAERRITDVLESIAEVFFAIDREWRFTFVNSKAAAYLGGRRQDLLGRSIRDLFPNVDDFFASEALHRAQEERTPVELEVQSRLRPGTWLEIHIYPTGEGVAVYAKDITLRKRMAEALRSSEERFRTLTEATSQIIWRADGQGGGLIEDSAWSEFTGQTPEEKHGWGWLDVVHPDDRATLAEAWQRASEAKLVFEWEHRLRRQDGEYRHMQVRAVPILGEDGSIREWVGADTDVTERKRTEAALQESEGRFRQLAEHMQEVFWMFTPDFSDTLYINPSYTELFGRTTRSLYEDARSFLDAVHPDDREVMAAAIAQISSQPATVECRIVRPDGTLRWISARGLPIRNAHGEIYRVAGITEDITQRKQTETAIRQAKDDAERANRAKSEFLSRMSHELRTPMNAILGFGQLLEYSALSAEDRESVEQILKAGRHLLALINEVLDLSRIEAGRITLSLEPVSLLDAVQQSISLLRMGAADRAITIADGAWHTCDRYVVADLQRLKQVLLNLLSNAIKYNRSGGTISIRCEESGESTLRLMVQDTGFGILPENMDRLFTPFDRLGAEQQHGVEGTGLGLALSRGLVEAMGGRLGAESVPDVGSTFWIELPLADQLVEANGSLPGRTLAGGEEPAVGHTILYVEDNLSNLRLVERIFAHRPRIKLVVAMQGGLGLDLARQHRPDLILLDLNLPDIPGSEVLQRLQQHSELRSTPVIVISADATPGQIHRMLSRGARAYLTKPLDIGNLLESVDSALSAGSEHEAERSLAETHRTR